MNGPAFSTLHLDPYSDRPKLSKQHVAHEVFDPDRPQHAVVWDFLARGFSITNAEAFDYWRYTRLGDVIYQIRGKSYYQEQDEYHLRTLELPKEHRDGTYGKYFLELKGL